jgi:hypothetical protein
MNISAQVVYVLLMFLKLRSISNCASFQHGVTLIYGIGGALLKRRLPIIVRNRGCFLQEKNFEDSLSTLLESVVSRSKRTLVIGRNNATQNDEGNSGVQSSMPMRPLLSSLFQSTTDRTMETISSDLSYMSTGEEIRFTTKTDVSRSEILEGNAAATKTQRFSRFMDHPGIKNTALAHLLWKECIHPWEDTVIDATCGNGNDSLALAKILFDSKRPASDYCLTSSLKPQLICLDIQQQAISNTISLLKDAFGNGEENIFQDYVTVSQASHERLLSKPRDLRSVGLVCYNLGFLPGGKEKDCTTQTASTIMSLVEASLLVRVGGIISVMTYPRTNQEEARLVKGFLTGLSLFSSRAPTSWEEELFNNTTYGSPEMNDFLRDSLLRTIREGCMVQTWRVFEHSSLGRTSSPVLLTATRIK